MNSRIRNQLVKLAKDKSNPMAYRNIIQKCELGLNMDIKHEKQLLGEILDEISEDEHKAGRPLLSAMVIGKKNGQGDRFFKLCEGLGMGEWKTLKADEDFLQNQIEACWDFWSDEGNYSKYF